MFDVGTKKYLSQNKFIFTFLNFFTLFFFLVFLNENQPPLISLNSAKVTFFSIQFVEQSDIK